MDMKLHDNVTHLTYTFMWGFQADWEYANEFVIVDCSRPECGMTAKRLVEIRDPRSENPMLYLHHPLGFRAARFVMDNYTQFLEYTRKQLEGEDNVS